MSLKEYEVVFITRESKELPGARYRAYSFSKYLEKSGYKSFVLSYHNDLGALSGELESYLTLRDKIYYNKSAYRYLKHYRNPLLIIQRFNYHSFAPFIYALRNHCKYILDLDDWEFRENTRYYLKFWPQSKAEFISRIIARRADICLAGSSFLYYYLKKINPRTFYLTPGLDLDIFYLKKFAPSERIILSWIGTLFRKEDYLNLVFLFRIMQIVEKKAPGIILEITADGIWKDKLEQESNRLKLSNIRFRGWINPQKIPEYLDNVALGVLPLSVKNKFTEAKFPVKVLEFMAKGIPVIASDFGEVKSIITDRKDGILVRNEKEFSDNILNLAKDDIFRKKLGLNARQKVLQQYDLSKQTQKLVKIIDEI